MPKCIECKITNIKPISVKKHKSRCCYCRGTSKRPISKQTRYDVWNHHIGSNIGESICVACDKNTISQLKFDCSHVISRANGGPDTIDNMIPLCHDCNVNYGPGDIPPEITSKLNKVDLPKNIQQEWWQLIQAQFAFDRDVADLNEAKLELMNAQAQLQLEREAFEQEKNMYVLV